MGYSINTNQHTPFASIENEKLIVEICDSLSIGAAIENMILTATGYGLGTLWIANTCFAYNELMDFYRNRQPVDRNCCGWLCR